MSQITDVSTSTVPGAEIAGAKSEEPESGLLAGLSNLSTVKQIGLMVGLSASIALGFILVLWSQEPELRPLGEYNNKELLEVIDFLENNNVSYTLERGGSVLIDRTRFEEVRLGMMGEGLGIKSETADTLLDKDTGFGVSEKLETARLLRSREKNLARTIEQFAGINAAQVHLAIPRTGVFVRDRRKPSASVMLNVKGYNALNDEQVRSIVDLVASSIPELSAKNVTITDNYGRLHHSGTMSASEIENRKKFGAEQKKQSSLKQKIEEVLIPLVGPGNYTVQVNVSMDFAKKEQTRRSYNNDLPAIRSERNVDDFQTRNAVQGVPGALTNQPPADAQAPEQANPGENQQAVEEGGNRRIESEKNYELDTTVSHVKSQVGAIERVTVAVGLDYVKNPLFKPESQQESSDSGAETAEGEEAAAAAEGEEAAPEEAENAAAENAAGATAEGEQAAPAVEAEKQEPKIPRTAVEIENIRRLIQGVIGYTPQRGDVVEVLSFPFASLDFMPEPAPLQFYEQPWFERLIKPFIMLTGLLILIFGVLKPIMSKLATPTVEEGQLSVAEDVEADSIKLDVPEPTPDEVTISHDFEALGLPEPAIESAAHIKQAQSIAMDNSSLVAQVVRNWLEEG